MAAFAHRRILVPFDFTELARFALEHARRLNERGGGELELVYAVPPIAEPVGPGEPRLSREAHDAIVAKLERAGGPGARGRVALGEPVEAIARAADRSRADLIVMGTEGRQGLLRWTRPSIAEKVVRRSPVPVLAVHGPLRAVRAVLAPVNLEPYSRAGLLAAAEAAADWGALLSVLTVIARPDRVAEARRGLSSQLGELPPELLARVAPQLIVETGKPIARILAHAPAFGLVSLVAHRRGAIGDAVVGTTAEQVLRRCPVPVLAVPDRAATPSPAAS